jgi:hypothetical protein
LRGYGAKVPEKKHIEESKAKRQNKSIPHFLLSSSPICWWESWFGGKSVQIVPLHNIMTCRKVKENGMEIYRLGKEAKV